MWFVLIIIWLFEALICYALAKEKNRDKWWGFLMGIVFGVFAIIYYCCCSKLAICPNCGKAIKTDSRICPHCNKKI